MNSQALHLLIDDMIEVLQSERRAVASLDVEKLNAFTARKEEQVERLQELMTDVPTDGPEVLALRAKLAEISIEAETNALLVRDSQEVIRAFLGEASNPGVYTSRGAIQSDSRRTAARSI
jgi:hypothetical protein